MPIWEIAQTEKYFIPVCLLNIVKRGEKYLCALMAGQINNFISMLSFDAPVITFNTNLCVQHATEQGTVAQLIFICFDGFNARNVENSS